MLSLGTGSVRGRRLNGQNRPQWWKLTSEQEWCTCTTTTSTTVCSQRASVEFMYVVSRLSKKGTSRMRKKKTSEFWARFIFASLFIYSGTKKKGTKSTTTKTTTATTTTTSAKMAMQAQNNAWAHNHISNPLLPHATYLPTPTALSVSSISIHNLLVVCKGWKRSIVTKKVNPPSSSTTCGVSLMIATLSKKMEEDSVNDDWILSTFFPSRFVSISIQTKIPPWTGSLSPCNACNGDRWRWMCWSVPSQLTCQLIGSSFC